MGEDKSGAVVTVRIAGVSELAAALAEGGPLRLLLGQRAADAFSELIGAGLAIPTEKLKSIRRRIAVDADGRALVDAAAFKELAARVAGDNEYLSSTAARALHRGVVHQSNLDEVTALAAEQLQAQPASEPSDDPVDPDFLDIFASLAGRASGNQMKSLFARILAGEIRQAGSYSLATLNAISLMDAKLAKTLVDLSGWVVNGVIPIVGSTARGPIFDRIALLADYGLVRIGGLTTKWPVGAERVVRLGLAQGNIGSPGIMVVIRPDFDEVEFDVAQLTRMGKEILSLIPEPPVAEEVSALCAAVASHPRVEAVHLGSVAESPDGKRIITLRR